MDLHAFNPVPADANARDVTDDDVAFVRDHFASVVGMKGIVMMGDDVQRRQKAQSLKDKEKQRAVQKETPESFESRPRAFAAPRATPGDDLLPRLPVRTPDGRIEYPLSSRKRPAPELDDAEDEDKETKEGKEKEKKGAAVLPEKVVPRAKMPDTLPALRQLVAHSCASILGSPTTPFEAIDVLLDLLEQAHSGVRSSSSSSSSKRQHQSHQHQKESKESKEAIDRRAVLLLSLAKLFSDLAPAYTIAESHPEASERLSRPVRLLREHEASLLRAYRRYLGCALPAARHDDPYAVRALALLLSTKPELNDAGRLVHALAHVRAAAAVAEAAAGIRGLLRAAPHSAAAVDVAAALADRLKTCMEQPVLRGATGRMAQFPCALLEAFWGVRLLASLDHRSAAELFAANRVPQKSKTHAKKMARRGKPSAANGSVSTLTKSRHSTSTRGEGGAEGEDDDEEEEKEFQRDWKESEASMGVEARRQQEARLLLPLVGMYFRILIHAPEAPSGHLDVACAGLVRIAPLLNAELVLDAVRMLLVMTHQHQNTSTSESESQWKEGEDDWGGRLRALHAVAELLFATPALAGISVDHSALLMSLDALLATVPQTAASLTVPQWDSLAEASARILRHAAVLRQLSVPQTAALAKRILSVLAVWPLGLGGAAVSTPQSGMGLLWETLGSLITLGHGPRVVSALVAESPAEAGVPDTRPLLLAGKHSEAKEKDVKEMSCMAEAAAAPFVVPAYLWVLLKFHAHPRVRAWAGAVAVACAEGVDGVWRAPPQNAKLVSFVYKGPKSVKVKKSSSGAKKKAALMGVDGSLGEEEEEEEEGGNVFGAQLADRVAYRRFMMEKIRQSYAEYQQAVKKHQLQKKASAKTSTSAPQQQQQQGGKKKKR
jgi:hypothetical protein